MAETSRPGVVGVSAGHVARREHVRITTCDRRWSAPSGRPAFNGLGERDMIDSRPTDRLLSRANRRKERRVEATGVRAACFRPAPLPVAGGARGGRLLRHRAPLLREAGRRRRCQLDHSGHRRHLRRDGGHGGAVGTDHLRRARRRSSSPRSASSRPSARSLYAAPGLAAPIRLAAADGDAHRDARRLLRPRCLAPPGAGRPAGGHRLLRSHRPRLPPPTLLAVSLSV